MNVKTKSLSLLTLCWVMIMSLFSNPIASFSANGETIDDYTWVETPKDIFFDDGTLSLDAMTTNIVDDTNSTIMFGIDSKSSIYGNKYLYIINIGDKFYTIDDATNLTVYNSTSLAEALTKSVIVIEGKTVMLDDSMFSDSTNADTVKAELTSGYLLMFNESKEACYKIALKDLESYVVKGEEQTIPSVKSYSTKFGYDKDGYINSVTVTGETTHTISGVSVAPDIVESTTLDNTKFTLKLGVSNDIDVVMNFTMEGQVIKTPLSITGVNDYNIDIADNEGDTTEEEETDRDEEEEPTPQVTLTVEGLPAKGSVDEGTEVTLTLKSNIEAKLIANDKESEGKATSLKFTVTQNGSYSYSATLDDGTVTAGSVSVDCFKVEDTYGDDTDPWEGDEEDIELVHTGLYDESNVNPLLIWGIIVGVIAVLTVVLYKTGILNKIGGKK